MNVNRPYETAYAGMATFCRRPLVLDPAELTGVDVAILGAPIDEYVTYRPGARFGPRAIRQADYLGVMDQWWAMDVGLDPFDILNVVDHGDLAPIPGYPDESHVELRKMVTAVCAAGAVPIVLGGDHSIAHPDVGAVADHFSPSAVGLIHFDSHADDAWEEGYRNHGTPLRFLVDEGSVKGENIVQVGLRGYWPPQSDFEWARGQGFRWHLMDEIYERGIDDVITDVIEEMSGLEHVFLSVDIDVVDPGSAPGTGTPEPGGLLPRELLKTVRRLAKALPISGMEVVEVAPPYDSADVTALLANRCVLEALVGMSLRRTGREPVREPSNT